MRLVLASNNAKKLAELRALLADLPLTLVPQNELGISEADEPHITFVENALAKARHAAQACGGPALADDSGLCVDALGGAPGVVSAHYASVDTGEGDREARRRIQDAANNALLLQQLQGVVDRRAMFVSTLVAVRHAQDPQPLVALGRWPGTITEAASGQGGFGYDPLMFIPEFGCTAAEVEPLRKNSHSHRARSVAQLRVLLREVWQVG